MAWWSNFWPKAAAETLQGGPRRATGNPTIEELFGGSAAEARAILYGPMEGIPRECIDECRLKMLWLANGDMTALRQLQFSERRDIEGEYQAEVNLERFRTPPKRNWKIDWDGFEPKRWGIR